ncbi:hypothetical protein NDU88_005387 [Pleurodeles waltl]|uniref:Uncharacterized protein n=1 Tax=Pleurodeles waltl TaxID=8319 RepID=A0AAV7QIV7_PLEWA|nr:hypothetical protein NDU88_005387 [Pleurodeles waltl]
MAAKGGERPHWRDGGPGEILPRESLRSEPGCSAACQWWRGRVEPAAEKWCAEPSDWHRLAELRGWQSWVAPSPGGSRVWGPVWGHLGWRSWAGGAAVGAGRVFAPWPHLFNGGDGGDIRSLGGRLHEERGHGCEDGKGPLSSAVQRLRYGTGVQCTRAEAQAWWPTLGIGGPVKGELWMVGTPHPYHFLGGDGMAGTAGDCGALPPPLFREEPLAERVSGSRAARCGCGHNSQPSLVDLALGVY